MAVWARPGQAGRHGGAGLSEATGVSYGVVEAAVEVVDVLADGEEEAVVEASIVEMIEGACVYRKPLNPDVMVMEPAKDGEGFDASGPLNRANGWRVFVQ